jgi:hypothetical protein
MYQKTFLTAPIEFNYSELPYHALTWGSFEMLTFRLICAEFKAENCSMYGSPGQKQHGFDLFIREEDDFYTLIQCKYVNSFKRTDLQRAIEIWEQGTWFNKTKRFVLASSNHLLDNTFIDELEIQKRRFKSAGIKIEAWGRLQLDTLLKCYPGIIEEFFGVLWRDKFSNTPSLKSYLGGILPNLDHPTKQYSAVQFYIERRLTNPGKTVVVSEHYSRFQQIKLVDYIEDCISENLPARVLIKAEAATGKSKELENAAYYYSSENRGIYPVLIKLKNFHGKLESYISSFDENWNKITPQRLLLLFDGLDELPALIFDEFIKKFNSFVQRYDKSHIVASIRTNVFTKEIGNSLDDQVRLKEFMLYNLEKQDIDYYLIKRISSVKARSSFDNFAKKTCISEMLSSPFYLSALTDLFLDGKEGLPSDRAGAIKKITKYKVNKDKDKYGSDFSVSELLKFGSRLALYLTLTGINAIEEEELQEFTKLSVTEIRRCSLFKVENSGLTEIIFFEHNNFQEYLAAMKFSILDWEKLEPILFHQEGVRLLKPKMFNTINYLFSILPTENPVFDELLNTLIESDCSVLLKFEKDKIPVDQRLYIFKKIILKGKEERIYYLSGDYNVFELCLFINNSSEGFNFLLEEFKGAEELNHLYCLADLIYYYDQLKVDMVKKEKLKEILKVIISTEGFEHGFYDRIIDIYTKYRFFTWTVLQDLKNCSKSDHKMVRAAILMYIEEGNFAEEFDYAFSSDEVLTSPKFQNSINIESVYIRLILKFLNESNAVSLLNHWTVSHMHLANITRYKGYSEDKRGINKIYEKLGLLTKSEIDHPLTKAFVNFLSAIRYKIHKKEKWGDPSIFFKQFKDTEPLFWDFLRQAELAYFLSDFYTQEIGLQLIEKFRLNELSLDDVYRFRTDVRNEVHEQFQTLLLLNFGNQFRYREVPDWEKDNAIRHARDCELMLDHEKFLHEAIRVYQLIDDMKGNLTLEERIYELEYSEKSIIRKEVKSTIILMAISEYEIKGGYSEFLGIFNKKGWEWYVFQTVEIYLNSRKAAVLKDLLIFAENYLITNIIPRINFYRVITETDDDSFTYNLDSHRLINFYTYGAVNLSEDLTLEMLKLDYYGFSKDVLNEGEQEKKIYQLVQKSADQERFRIHVLDNLSNSRLPDRVITTHAKICAEYLFLEGLPVILQLLSNAGFSQRLKSYLVNNIIQLADGPDIFEDIIYFISSINFEWEFDICKYLVKQNIYKDKILILIEKSSLATSTNDSEVYWKFELVVMGIRLGSKIVTEYVFEQFYLNLKSNHYLNIKPDFFTKVAQKEPEFLMKLCIAVIKKYAPIFVPGNRNELSELLEETIRLCAVSSKELFNEAIRGYNLIIQENINGNPEISYLNWYKRRLIKSYLSHAVSYESKSLAINILNSFEI